MESIFNSPNPILFGLALHKLSVRSLEAMAVKKSL
jgi:hypothetical protein